MQITKYVITWIVATLTQLPCPVADIDPITLQNACKEVHYGVQRDTNQVWTEDPHIADFYQHEFETRTDIEFAAIDTLVYWVRDTSKQMQVRN